MFAMMIVNLGCSVEGLENLPKDGKYIIASNHQSVLGNLWLFFALLSTYPQVAVQKQSLIKVPLFGIFLKSWMISIDRNNPSGGMRKFLNDER